MTPSMRCNSPCPIPEIVTLPQAPLASISEMDAKRPCFP